MELLYPSMEVYIRSKIARVVYGALFVVAGLLIGAVLLFL
jgi:hypothetical protein